MTDTSAEAKPHWNRTTRPERIDVIDDVLVRNDVIAAQQGMSVRALDRRDADGAPYVFIGSVKYRPAKEYAKFLIGRIERKNQAPKRRRRHST